MASFDPITKASTASIDALACMVGGRLEEVRYHYLPPAGGPTYAGDASGVDADVTAVVLELSNRGTRTLTWAMQRGVEGIALLDDGQPYAGRADEVIVRNSRDGWRDCVGDTIVSIGGAWQTSDRDVPESLWAVRLNFGGDRSVIIALGTLETELQYMPDELIVIFDQGLMMSYRPAHINDSAWGHELTSHLNPASDDVR